jgi:DNA repair protein RadA
MGVKELCTLEGVGQATAEKLVENGINDLIAVAARTARELSDVTGMSEKVCRKLIADARTKGGFTFQSALEYEKDTKDLFYISTRSKNLDGILNGGIRSKSITECYGEFGSGKTQIAHQIAVMVQLPPHNGTCVYIDTEGSFRPERIRSFAKGLGVDPEQALKNILLVRSHNTDMQVVFAEQVENVLTQNKKKYGDIKLVVVDSLTAAFRAEYIGREQLPARAGKLNRHMQQLHRFADLYNAAIFVTNQVFVTPGISFGDPTNPAGGHIVGHASTYRVYLRKAAKGARAAILKDAPELPDNVALFAVTEEGLIDVAGKKVDPHEDD